jgi:hypothetical protein
MNKLASVAPGGEAKSTCDLAWWAMEAERADTDWRGILLTTLRRLELIAPCPICECEPCPAPSFCQLCREADAKRRQQPKTITLRPIARPTLEAIKQSVRNCGLAALKESATRERLARCDDAARAEIDRWLTHFKTNRAAQ